MANRGEIAVRIIRAARDMGHDIVAVYAADDADTPHVSAATTAVAIPGTGAGAYLNLSVILDAARSTGATLIHPGYGFLSESAEFAHACASAGLTFVGPVPELLERFGDKAAARIFLAGHPDGGRGVATIGADRCGPLAARGGRDLLRLHRARRNAEYAPSGQGRSTA